MTDHLTDAALAEGEGLLRNLHAAECTLSLDDDPWAVAWHVWREWMTAYSPALIAEVRRLRERVAELEDRRKP